MATPPTFPISTASFWSNTYTFDPLYASETIAQSVTIAAGLVLKRGTVLGGPTYGATILSTTVIGTSIAIGAAGQRMRQIADHVETFAESLQRLQDLAELEPAPFRRRSPLAHDGAMRDVDARQTCLGRRRRLAQGRLRGHHRLQQRQ